MEILITFTILHNYFNGIFEAIYDFVFKGLKLKIFLKGLNNDKKRKKERKIKKK